MPPTAADRRQSKVSVSIEALTLGIVLRPDYGPADSDVGDGLFEDLERGARLVLTEDQGRRDADRVVAASQREQAACERSLLHRGRLIVVGERDPDPQRPAAHLRDDRVALRDLAHAREEDLADR